MLGLLRSNHGEFCNLCVFFIKKWWFRCFCHSDCYSLVNYCRHWVGNQQNCCFRKFLQRCHSACSVPFRWMVNEGCDCYCFRWWYGQGFVSDDWLWFGGCLTWGCLTCIVKRGKCLRPCVVSMTTLLFLIKCNPNIGPFSFFITTKCSANELSLISILVWLLMMVSLTGPWLLVFENWEDHRFWECYSGLSVWWFPSHPGQLRWQIHQSIYRQIILKIQRHVEHFLLPFQDYCGR